MADPVTIPIDYRNFLTSSLTQNQVWVDFADAISNIFEAYIHEPRRELAKIRDTRSTERIYLQKNVKMLGFEYNSSLLTDDDYRRLMQFLALYYQQNGTKTFAKFFGYIKDTFFDIFQLWTTDYQNFIEEFVINMNTDPITRGGHYYPTSHVALYYNAENFPITDPNDLTQLFYQIAPIHLVLKYIVAALYGTGNLYFAEAGTYMIEDFGVYNQSNNGGTTVYFAEGFGGTLIVNSGAEEQGAFSGTGNVYNAEAPNSRLEVFSGRFVGP